MACFGGVRIGNWNWNWPSFSILCLRTNYLTAANPNPAKPVDTCKTEISVGGVVDDLLPMLPTISKVAVIGAGSAGLAAARRLRDRGIETTIFECNSVAGGAWIYDEQKPARPSFPSAPPSDCCPRLPDGKTLPFTEYYDDETVWLRHAPPGPCYEALMINIETALMRFEGHKYPPGTEPFVGHRSILEYLQRFSEDFELESITRYDTRVENLRKISEGGKSVWKLLLRQLSRDELGRTVGTWYEETFDAVVVASGHYHVEYIPDIPGLAEWAKKWPESLSHAKEFRRPEGVDDKTVVVIGSGFSSLDIAREISPFVKHIYRSMRAEEKCSLEFKIFRNAARSLNPENLSQVAEIERFGPVDRASRAQEAQIFLEDGTVLEGVDKIVFCTGYLYVFPFIKSTKDLIALDKDSDSIGEINMGERALITDGMQVHNLLKDIFYIYDPTLAFIGIPKGVVTLPFFDVQAMAVAAIFAGTTNLPTVSEMKSEYEEQKAKEGRIPHWLGISLERKYVEDIMGWISEGNGARAGFDENWYLTRFMGLEKFMRNRLSNRYFHPNLEARDIEAKVQELRREVERLVKAAAGGA